MISKWWDSHQASHLIIGTDSALFVGFCSQRLFMDVKERVSYLKVNGFNWIFQKQKTDNGRNFVPISLINMKVFWDSLQFAVVILIVEKIKHSEPECFAVWRSVKCLLVWRSGHGSVSLQGVRVDRDCDDENELSLSWSCEHLLNITSSYQLMPGHSDSRIAPTSLIYYWSRYYSS